MQVLFESSAVLSQRASNRSTRENGTFGNHKLPRMKLACFERITSDSGQSGIVRASKKTALAGNSSYDAGRSKCRDYLALRSGPSQPASNARSLNPGLHSRRGNLVARVKPMRETGEDWLSRTMGIVEAVMERHGFEDDGVPKVKAPAKSAAKPGNDGNLWNKLLRRAAFLSPL